MKKLIMNIMLFTSLIGIFGFADNSDPKNWSSQKISKWFEKGEWLNGWKIKPDGSVNRREFVISYFKNRDRWNKAFVFLKNNDLSKLDIKRYELDGDNLYAPVSEYVTKNAEDAKYEAHRKYIDIQYVISGVEQMSVSPLSMKKEVITQYDAEKDIEFMTVSGSKEYTATPDRFFIFFPSDIHRPGVKVGENSKVKKIVIKVKVD